MNFLIQCLISYLGLLPYFYLLIDLYFIEMLSPEIIHDIMLYNTLIIFTFIGAINWDFKKNNIIYTIYGFIPSLIAFFIMVLNVLNYEKYFDKGLKIDSPEEFNSFNTVRLSNKLLTDLLASIGYK